MHPRYRAYSRRDALRFAGGTVAGGLLAACAAPGTTRTAAQSGDAAFRVDVVATGLDTIWGLAFAPDGRLFVTERPGRIRVIENGQLREAPVLELPARETAGGEGGLMGLALDAATFPRDPFLYVAYTAETGQGGTRNRLVRLRLDGDTAREDGVLLDDLPAGTNHNGGRVKFGPDGKLYATLGEQYVTQRAQDRAALAGKIVRLNGDGTVPDDNPFPGSPVFSWGHRNPQGLAWQPGTGRLYATEHGQSLNDEVNLIEAGENYGWPMAEGATHPAPYRAPLAAYRAPTAPGGATFSDSDALPQWRGNLFFAALRGTHLHRIALDANDPRRIAGEERLLDGQYGRLRDVVQGPDGALYVATSNRDGRGNPNSEDDRVLRIGPR